MSINKTTDIIKIENDSISTSETTIEELKSPSQLIKEFEKNKKESEIDEKLDEIELIDYKENYNGNYEEYVYNVLSSIKPIVQKDFNKIILDKKIKIKNLNKNKKIILLDLDETLIHSDYKEEYQGEYDFYINMTIDNIDMRIGIFMRPGTKEFLEEISKFYEIGIFTAATKEYADKIIDFLDPQKKYIKFRLYQESCIKINDFLYIKDLNIFEGIDLKNIILIDNNLYTFANQLKNGILIYSFYNDKNDKQLFEILNYLKDVVYYENDVRQINEDVFHFEDMYNNLQNEH